MSIFSSSLCKGLAAACDCGTPWTFLFTFFLSKYTTSFPERVHTILFPIPVIQNTEYVLNESIRS